MFRVIRGGKELDMLGDSVRSSASARKYYLTQSSVLDIAFVKNYMAVTKKRFVHEFMSPKITLYVFVCDLGNYTEKAILVTIFGRSHFSSATMLLHVKEYLELFRKIVSGWSVLSLFLL